MSCNLINLISGSSSSEVCSGSTTNPYYLSYSGIAVGVTAYTDSGCSVIAPNGFYVTNGYRQTWGEINSGDGIFNLTGICYDCSFTGFTLLVPQVTTFVDCCNPGHFFNIAHDLGTFTVGEFYHLDTSNFVGCAIVVPYNNCYPTYTLNTATLEVDCETCYLNNSIVCPYYVCQVTKYVLDTGGVTPYDDTYTIVGSEGYNDHNYFVGETAPNRFLFFDGSKWCLADTLGGSCLLFGNEVCNGECPDLCNLEDWTCTTTTSNPCDIVDFDAIFDCDPTPSPTPTPTITPTITTTPTPTPSTTPADICSGTSISLSGTTLPGETPTPTPTPSQTPPNKVCFTDNITHNIINEQFNCP